MNRPHRKYTLHQDKVELESLVGRKYKLISGKEKLDSSNMCFGVSFFSSQTHAPGHIHEKEEEMVYVLEGKGEMVFDGFAEEIREGTFICIPPGVEHSVNNTGKKTIKLLYVFSPPIIIGAYENRSPRRAEEN